MREKQQENVAKHTSFGPELHPDHYDEHLCIYTAYRQDTMQRPAEWENTYVIYELFLNQSDYLSFIFKRFLTTVILFTPITVIGL